MTPINEWDVMKEVGNSTHLDAKVASVDVAPEEEVAGFGGMTADLEQCHEIMLRYGKLTGTDRTNG